MVINSGLPLIAISYGVKRLLPISIPRYSCYNLPAIFIQWSSDLLEEFSHQGAYVSEFIWCKLDGVLYAVQVPAQDLLVEFLDAVTVTHFFSAIGSNPLWPVTLVGGKSRVSHAASPLIVF